MCTEVWILRRVLLTSKERTTGDLMIFPGEAPTTCFSVRPLRRGKEEVSFTGITDRPRGFSGRYFKITVYVRG